VCNQASATRSAIVAALPTRTTVVNHSLSPLLRKSFVDPAVRLLRTWRLRPEATHNHAGQMLMVPPALSDLFHK
jgi:hypothetical protein